MFTILDYSRALEYSIIRRYTNIVYYYYYTKNREVKVYTYNNHIQKVTKIQLDSSFLIKKTLRK